MTTTITSLNSLLHALKTISEARADPERFGHTDANEAELAYCRSVGLPVHLGACDWTSLPTFGGEEPADTTGIWSWDETHVLTGTCADDLTIEPRAAD